MRKLRYIFYLVLSFVFISGCNHLEEGVIVGKHYEPMQQNMMMLPIVISTGKTTTTMMMPFFVTDNEDYVLHIKGIHKGEEIIEEVYTSKECYNRMQNGDSWTKTYYCSFSDDNNTKERRD